MQSVSQKKSLSSKNAIASIILVVNALCWYLHFFSFLKNNSGYIGSALVIIVGLNLLSVSLSAILSAKLIQKIQHRLKFLIYWMAIGVLLSPLYLLIGNLSFFSVTLIGCILGIYFGLGSPILMGYYSASTEDTNRAKISGLTIFLTFTCFIVLTIVAQTVLYLAIIMTLWKLCGLIAVILLKPSDFKFNSDDSTSYKRILSSRSILLYFVPWLLFSIVNNFAFPVLDASFPSEVVRSATMVENFLAGILAVLFGFLADRFGRKRLVFIGFVMLGLGYAILGLLPTYHRGFYFYTVADSIAWGIFLPLFLLTIWGDIAGKRNGEKFFAIGFLPYIISNFLQVAFGYYVADSITNFSIVFSFASLFLFVTIVPLFLAPETMSEKERKEKELQKYLEKACKMAEESVSSESSKE